MVEIVGLRMHTNLPVVSKPCGAAVHSVAKRNICAAVATNLALLIAWRPMMSTTRIFQRLRTKCFFYSHAMRISPTGNSFRHEIAAIGLLLTFGTSVAVLAGIMLIWPG